MIHEPSESCTYSLAWLAHLEHCQGRGGSISLRDTIDLCLDEKADAPIASDLYI